MDVMYECYLDEPVEDGADTDASKGLRELLVVCQDDDLALHLGVCAVADGCQQDLKR